jgi:hypothetical protein
MASLGFNMTPSRADLIEDRHAYFAEYGAQRAAAVAERDGETVDPDDDPTEGDDEDWVIVTEPSVAVSLSEVPAGAKAAMLAAAKNGWEALAWRTRTHVEATRFKSTTETHNAGDIRFRAKDVRNYYVTAKAAGSRLGFTASWSGEDLAGKGDAQKTGGFSGATLYDPAGLEVELYFDYKETRASVLALGEAMAKKHADLQDWTYNDAKKTLTSTLFTNKSANLAGWIKKHMKDRSTV